MVAMRRAAATDGTSSPGEPHAAPVKFGLRQGLSSRLGQSGFYTRPPHVRGYDLTQGLSFPDGLFDVVFSRGQWIRKKTAYRELDITVVTPSRWHGYC